MSTAKCQDFPCVWLVLASLLLFVFNETPTRAQTEVYVVAAEQMSRAAKTLASLGYVMQPDVPIDARLKPGQFVFIRLFSALCSEDKSIVDGVKMSNSMKSRLTTRDTSNPPQKNPISRLSPTRSSPTTTRK